MSTNQSIKMLPLSQFTLTINSLAGFFPFSFDWLFCFIFTKSFDTQNQTFEIVFSFNSFNVRINYHNKTEQNDPIHGNSKYYTIYSKSSTIFYFSYIIHFIFKFILCFSVSISLIPSFTLLLENVFLLIHRIISKNCLKPKTKWKVQKDWHWKWGEEDKIRKSKKTTNRTTSKTATVLLPLWHCFRNLPKFIFHSYVSHRFLKTYPSLFALPFATISNFFSTYTHHITSFVYLFSVHFLVFCFLLLFYNFAIFFQAKSFLRSVFQTPFNKSHQIEF